MARNKINKQKKDKGKRRPSLDSQIKKLEAIHTRMGGMLAKCDVADEAIRHNAGVHHDAINEQITAIQKELEQQYPKVDPELAQQYGRLLKDRKAMQDVLLKDRKRGWGNQVEPVG